MTFHRRGLEIGPFNLFGLEINPTFHWYGLIIVLGIAALLVLAMLVLLFLALFTVAAWRLNAVYWKDVK